jgi:energy-coupling factor transporter transmembrane protein EcfT
LGAAPAAHSIQVLHPATLLIAWVAAIISLQCVEPFNAIAATVLVASLFWSGAEMCRLVWRIRWLLLPMAMLFIWMTPGLLLPGPWGHMGMTVDGLNAAGDHVLRLMSILGMLALLLNKMTRPDLVAGLFALMRPLTFLGADRKKIALRLMLTLTYVATEKDRDWRAAFRPNEAADDTAVMYLVSPRWTALDIVLLAGLGGLVLRELMRA